MPSLFACTQLVANYGERLNNHRAMNGSDPWSHHSSVAPSKVLTQEVTAPPEATAAVPSLQQQDPLLPSKGALPRTAVGPRLGPTLPLAVGSVGQAVGVDGAVGGDVEDGTCRTSSAYILLQLRDLGRSSSGLDGVVDSEAAPTAATATTTAAAAANTAAPAAPPSSPTAAALSPTLGAGDAVQQPHHDYQQDQHQDGRAILQPGGGSHFNMGPASNPATAGFESGAAAGMMGAAAAGAAAAAAIERGMYVAGLLPGFQGGAPPAAAAAAASQTALLAQLPQQIPRQATSAAGGGGSAALRPICPKTSPETVMVVSPTTGQLVPVSVFGRACFTEHSSTPIEVYLYMVFRPTR